MMTHSSIRASWQPLPSPHDLLTQYPADKKILSLVAHTRHSIDQIFQQQDDRLLVVVGPCSIHDTSAALDYAQQLQAACSRWQQELLIVMRVYFEKPRTGLGWKGFLNDPKLDGSNDIALGLKLARSLLLSINALGLPTATEFLDHGAPQYFGDLISWAAIGARTCESPPHRELASGLAMPVGFKNTTAGDIDAAIAAVRMAQHPQRCFGLNAAGHWGAWWSPGNPLTHLVLRGGKGGPNYTPHHLDATATALRQAGLVPRVMVDCSHGNSNKDYRQQPAVLRVLGEQILAGESSVFGVMLESHLQAGAQPLSTPTSLAYGVSITDGCLGLTETLDALAQLAATVRTRRRLALTV